MTRNPFDDIERMFDRMSRQFEEFDPGTTQPGGVGTSDVDVDLRDDGDAFVLTADLPGFETDDIDVELADDTLRLSATRETAAETRDLDVESGRYLRRERSRQSVRRSVRLPEPVDESATSAEYRNGVLTVTLPKQEPEEGHDIPIN